MSSDTEHDAGVDRRDLALLARRLPRWCRLRARLVAGPLDPDAEPLTDLYFLCNVAASASPLRWRERVAAARLIGRYSPAPLARRYAIERLSESLRLADPVKGDMAHSGLCALVPIYRAAWIAAGVLYAALCTRMSDLLVDKIVSFLLVVCIVALLSTAVPSFISLLLAPLTAGFTVPRDNLARAALVEALGRLGDPLALTAVSTAAHDGSSRVRAAADEALKRLLPALVVEEARLVPPVEDRLWPLIRREDRDLQVAILRALEAGGSARSLEAVRACADTAADAEVGDLARRAAAAIHQRTVRALAASLLVRAADAPPDALLRPASQEPAVEQQVLLRPSDGNGSG